MYALAGVLVLGVAGLMVYRALSSSLVYFVLPSEYAADPAEYAGRRLRLGGFVEPGSVNYDDKNLQLAFKVTDRFQTYPVHYKGAPPNLFREDTGVVIEGSFDGDTFQGDNLLIKHSEVYEAPKDGEPLDLENLRDTLQ